MSASVNLARRALTPRAASMATVATAVISGKCQKSHTMVVADRVKIANSAAIFVLTFDDESVMPASPKSMQRIPAPLIQQVALLNDHILTSSRARNKRGDSFCKTATSRREDVLRGVDVAVVDRSAVAASPGSHSKTCDTLWATGRTARRTGLGRKSFVNFSERCACEIALIPEHRSKGRPAGIEHRLGVRCLRERGGA